MPSLTNCSRAIVFATLVPLLTTACATQVTGQGAAAGQIWPSEAARTRGQIIAGTQVLADNDAANSQLRLYRAGPVYAHITGYDSTIYNSAGIERAEDDQLSPRAGGNNVLLTIEPQVQKVAFDQLSSKNYVGAVVALRPQTGEILAMASTPSFDPNLLAGPNAAVQKSAWGRLTSSIPPPLLNRASSAKYPAGSTFMLIDAAAALSSGRYTPTSPLTAAPHITLAGTNTTLENFNGNACGTAPTTTLREALQRSCNTAFAQLAGDLGTIAIRDQATAFGIGTPDQTIPILVAPSTIGSIPDTSALQQTGIGQRDVAITPLQNAMIVATIANGGQAMAPHLVKEVRGPDQHLVETIPVTHLKQAMDAGVARTLTDLMVNNENSYGGAGKIPGVQIAAKTGTAEPGGGPKASAPHVWYVAFAPAENPRVAVAVLIESAGDRDNLAATGGLIAAPIGRAVIAAALNH